MRSMLYATASLCAIAGIGSGEARGADLDDEHVTHETIVEEHPLVEHERVIVRRYAEPRYDDVDDYADDDDDPEISVATPMWRGHSWRHHHHEHRRWGHHRR